MPRICELRKLLPDPKICNRSILPGVQRLPVSFFTLKLAASQALVLELLTIVDVLDVALRNDVVRYLLPR